jgi:hypothetical protein
MGTLTLGNSNSMHTPIFPIFLYKSCSIATPECNRPLLPRKFRSHRRLRTWFAESPLSWRNRVPLSQLYYRALITLILIKESYPGLRASLLCWEIVISFVAAIACKCMQIHARSPRGSIPFTFASSPCCMVTWSINYCQFAWPGEIWLHTCVIHSCFP